MTFGLPSSAAWTVPTSFAESTSVIESPLQLTEVEPVAFTVLTEPLTEHFCTATLPLTVTPSKSTLSVENEPCFTEIDLSFRLALVGCSVS